MTTLIETLAAIAAGILLAIELANPEHQVFTGQTVTFTVPGVAR